MSLDMQRCFIYVYVALLRVYKGQQQPTFVGGSVHPHSCISTQKSNPHKNYMVEKNNSDQT